MQQPMIPAGRNEGNTVVDDRIALPLSPLAAPYDGPIARLSRSDAVLAISQGSGLEATEDDLG